MKPSYSYFLSRENEASTQHLCITKCKIILLQALMGCWAFFVALTQQDFKSISLDWINFISCVPRLSLATSLVLFVHVKSLQLCLTLCDTMGCSPPGSSVHGILQERILERVAMPSSRGPSRPRDWICISYGPCICRWVLNH